MAVTAMLSHVGVCVSDLAASKLFYSRVFGFEETYSRRVGNDFARLMQRPSLDVEVCVLTLGRQRIELVHHYSPDPVVEPVRATNTIGYTHVAIYVPDVAATAALAEHHGGRVLWETHTELDVAGEHREYLYVMDPDSVRIELIRGLPLG
ncbi:hypothetical protein RW1_043_00770 [Rhodococcus wratislaviensis NBRC 100605]|uniref:VOC domain-containing protein n=1 Tax=Rhodococcus wratislaviensis NBRC 100605 TaxID=1219028 RepID=X0Q842_RHOWR|nr:hypothetical protein RW1_043_00770 [Rhodococcus wratislaviensis NBRC 100605]